ncbi:MAG: arginine--tRNA ligase [Planctomycetota bacterium]
MKEFHEAVARIAEAAGVPYEAALSAVGVPRERDRADLALPCFPFAKALRRAPPEIAAAIADAFEPNDLIASAEATGPFVNFRINRSAFARGLLDAVGPAYGTGDEGAGETVVIDYGSPNIAKPLLFHHLRSSVIGQALVRIHRARGYEVVGLNYLGDIGTAFGKLMVGIEEYGEPTDVEAFKKTYVRASSACADNEAWMDRARAWTKRLEEGDAEAEKHWRAAREMSLAGFAEVYDRLGVVHDVVDGERMYVDRARKKVEELLASGEAIESDGGVVIETGEKVPFLIRKSDGATLYGTRDIVAAIDRWDRYHFARMLYVVDVAQQHYFKQLFAALRRAGCEWADRCGHVMFGQVLVEGSRTKTREGGGIQLEEVLDEGFRRALVIVDEKNPDLPDKEDVARAVGTAAVIFCDVGFPTTKNINFDWDQILSFDGRTGPYLQYVHASACSILRKGGGKGEGADPALLDHEKEWELLRRLAEYPDAVRRACEECEPSHVSNCLYELARDFRAYHAAGGRDAALRVLVDDDAVRGARLRLVEAVRSTLGNGLTMLGIEPLEVM